MTNIRSLAQDIAAAPLGDLIAQIGRGVAEAQAALDAGSLRQTLDLYEQGDAFARILRETGYRPTFYTIPETTGELKLALTLTGRVDPPAPRPVSPTATTLIPIALARDALVRRLPAVYAAPVDARYANGYAFSSSVSATVTFRIVAVPPPASAESVRVVPDFSGLAEVDAVRLADSFDLGISAPDGATTDAPTTGQIPSPGTLARAGDVVSLTFD